MDFNWPVAGHKTQLEFLENAYKRDKLAHAYIFAGPEGVGKKQIAFRLAQELLKNEGESNNFNADYIELSGEGSIKIEQIRELIYKLSLKPYSSKYKVAVIDKAEGMTTEAANALLKLMEEPKSYTIMFLITSNPSRLPKTILSRGQKITFGPIAGQEEKLLSQSPEAMKYFESFNSKDAAERLIAAYELADLEVFEIKNILYAWLVKLQMDLRTSVSLKLAQKILEVSRAIKYLDQNANNKLLLTNLMLNT
jgi:DNA polymerase III delta prime subunit